MPGKKKLPSTLEKSPKHAQDIFRETLVAAEKEYGVGERASRTAFASLKHSFEKVGDHWEAKDEKGPSEPDTGRDRETFGGVDIVGHTKDELLTQAQRVHANVSASMTKAEIAREIDKRNKSLSRND
jgi:hypothetical protein